jgi:hypothetical protein
MRTELNLNLYNRPVLKPALNAKQVLLFCSNSLGISAYAFTRFRKIKLILEQV